MKDDEKNNDASELELLDKTKKFTDQVGSIKNTLLDIKHFKLKCEEHLIKVKRHFLKKTYEAEEKILDLESSILSIENKLNFSSPNDKPYYTMKLTKETTNLKDARKSLKEIKSTGKNETVSANNVVKLINIKLSTLIRGNDEIAPLYVGGNTEANNDSNVGNKAIGKGLEKTDEEKRHNVAKIEFKPLMVKQNLFSKGVLYFDDFYSFALDAETAKKLTEVFNRPTFGAIIKGSADELKTHEDRVCIINNSIDGYIEIKTTYQPKINSILKSNGWSFVGDRKSWEINLESVDKDKIKIMIDALSEFFDILIDTKTSSIRKKKDFRI